jgi:predicted 3-demethylubiquinone-9 3-methyltransferase (glyoxalase superfamily)
VHRITPCLWFDGNAEEAVQFYTSVLTNSRIGRITRYGEAGKEVHGRPAGSVLTIEFEIDGQSMMALNGGPMFKFNEAVSFQVHCASQDEIDYYWERLSEGGDVRDQQCGWLKDRYGLSWQIVPTALGQMLQDKDAGKSGRVMSALMGMKKLDLGELRRAYEHR